MQSANDSAYSCNNRQYTSRSEVKLPTRIHHIDWIALGVDIPVARPWIEQTSPDRIALCPPAYAGVVVAHPKLGQPGAAVELAARVAPDGALLRRGNRVGQQVAEGVVLIALGADQAATAVGEPNDVTHPVEEVRDGPGESAHIHEAAAIVRKPM